MPYLTRLNGAIYPLHLGRRLGIVLVGLSTIPIRVVLHVKVLAVRHSDSLELLEVSAVGRAVLTVRRLLQHDSHLASLICNAQVQLVCGRLGGLLVVSIGGGAGLVQLAALATALHLAGLETAHQGGRCELSLAEALARSCRRAPLRFRVASRRVRTDDSPLTVHL